MKRSEEFYEGDRKAVLSTAGRGETMQDVLDRRWSRRTMVKGAAGTGLVLTLGAPALAQARQATPAASPEASPVAAAAPFEPIALDLGEDMVVAAGHVAVPFLR
jgi:secreted PhoX family phosphatase